MFQNHAPGVPLVSAIICAYEGDAHLAPRAIASVAAQDLDPRQLELLVVFDGPPSEKASDLINEALEPLADHLHDVKFFWPPEAYGYYCQPRNMATMFAEGLYIANLDADNEWRPQHLSGLLKAIREPDPALGWVHFTYSRREYVKDEGAPPNTHTGISLLEGWTPKDIIGLIKAPTNNWIDSSDFLIARSVMMDLARVSGDMWNPEAHRFGDWELMARLAIHGFRGKPVDQVTNVYHWTGNNLQLNRPANGQVPGIPERMYDKMKEKADAGK